MVQARKKVHGKKAMGEVACSGVKGDENPQCAGEKKGDTESGSWRGTGWGAAE
jgi:hypothetical protein